MKRMDRYHGPRILPPVPRKGIIVLPPCIPPHFDEASSIHMTHVSRSDGYHQRKVRSRRLRYGLTDYEDFICSSGLDSENIASAMSLPSISSTGILARLQRFIEIGKNSEVLQFLKRMSYSQFRSLLPSLPSNFLYDTLPESLSLIEILYSKSNIYSDKLINHLGPQNVVWQLVKFFAHQDNYKWEHTDPLVISTKKLLKALVSYEPKIKAILFDRQKALKKAIEGLGQHGMVGTSDKTLMNLHDALKDEFKKVLHSYTEALVKLEAMSNVNKIRKAPIAQSHQRQLSCKEEDIQERLIKNKTLLNAVDSTLENTSLEVLLGILQKRIELDKECLFQYNQVKKDSEKITREKFGSIAPLLMKFQRGCNTILNWIKEINEYKEDEEGNNSDISGYHSDSESCVMTSGNSPFISKEERYNFLSRSVRLGSKHNIRSSLLAVSNFDSRSCLSDGGNKKDNSLSLPLHGSTSGNGLRDSDSLTSSISHPIPLSPSSSSTSSSQTIQCTSSKTVPRNKTSKPKLKSEITSNCCYKCESLKEGNINEILEHDISSLRKNAEILSLTNEIEELKNEKIIHQSKILSLLDKEKDIQRTLSMEKYKNESLDKMVQVSNYGLESPNLKKPSDYIKKYGEIYSVHRLDTLASLDKLPQLQNLSELKNKLLFSVVVLAFRSTFASMTSKRNTIRRLLQIPNPSDVKSSSRAKELENALSVYFSRSSQDFDLSKNVGEVCDQIWATLYDYPCIKYNESIIQYIKECTRTAWGLVPVYCIDFESRTFSQFKHIRSQTSNHNSKVIKNYLWPALLEGKEGPVVSHAVVIT